MQGSIFLLRDDPGDFLAGHDVRRDVACGLPLLLRGESAQLHQRPGVPSVLRDEFLRHLRLAVGQGADLRHLRRAGLRDLIRDNLDDLHAVLGAQHELQVYQRGNLVSVRERIQQLVAQLAKQREVLFREMVVALGEDADEIIVAEVFLELIGFHQHRISLDKIVVEGGLLDHFGHALEGDKQEDGEQGDDHPAPSQQEGRIPSEELIDSVRFHFIR